MKLKTRQYLCYSTTIISAIVTLVCTYLEYSDPYNVHVLIIQIISGLIFILCAWVGHLIFDIPVLELEIPDYE
jgi:L-asparagine transporter-like permease